jgi:hypothetical protein
VHDALSYKLRIALHLYAPGSEPFPFSAAPTDERREACFELTNAVKAPAGLDVAGHNIREEQYPERAHRGNGHYLCPRNTRVRRRGDGAVRDQREGENKLVAHRQLT